MPRIYAGQEVVSSQRGGNDDITPEVAYRLHVRLAHKMAFGSEPVRTGA